MTAAILTGAFVGLGAFLLIRAMFPSRPGMGARLAEYDALTKHGRGPARPADPAAQPGEGRSERLQKSVGALAARVCADRGWELRSTRADLALVGKEYEAFLATKVLMPVVALVFTPLIMAVGLIFGGFPVKIPLWGGLAFAVLFFFYPDLGLKAEAEKAREDFRHVMGAFLDLVAMNLSGGRGVPEALMSASNIGDGWPMLRIREALRNARISGMTPWQALGALGDEINVVELGDLASALALVADDGAKVRQSLAARAASLRSREIAGIEGKAGQNSQTMLVAQLAFCLGFMVFLIYPSLVQVLNT